MSNLILTLTAVSFAIFNRIGVKIDVALGPTVLAMDVKVNLDHHVLLDQSHTYVYRTCQGPSSSSSKWPPLTKIRLGDLHTSCIKQRKYHIVCVWAPTLPSPATTTHLLVFSDVLGHTDIHYYLKPWCAIYKQPPPPQLALARLGPLCLLPGVAVVVGPGADFAAIARRLPGAPPALSPRQHPRVGLLTRTSLLYSSTDLLLHTSAVISQPHHQPPPPLRGPTW